MFILITGDDIEIPCNLEKEGKPFIISPSGTAKAVITTLDRTAIISTEVSVDMGALGTDLANSLIVVEFTKAESAAIALLAEPFYGEAILEVQLSDPKTKTWSKEILIRKGNIT